MIICIFNYTHQSHDELNSKLIEKAANINSPTPGIKSPIKN